MGNLINGSKQEDAISRWTIARDITGSPSSKYEHQHCCVLFEIQRKYKDLYGKKTYGFCNHKTAINRPGHKATRGLHRREVTHILPKVSCLFFFWNPFIFVGYRKEGFFPYKSLYFRCISNQLRNNADANILSLSYLWGHHVVLM